MYIKSVYNHHVGERIAHTDDLKERPSIGRKGWEGARAARLNLFYRLTPLNNFRVGHHLKEIIQRSNRQNRRNLTFFESNRSTWRPSILAAREIAT